MRAFFKDDDFDFLTRLALGACSYRAAEAGEVFETIERIRDKDGASWVAAWVSTADRLKAEADARRSAGHQRSAAAAYLRAAKYYELASYSGFEAGGKERFEELWGWYRDCWDTWVDLSGRDVERVEIPYEGTTLPGYFFRAGPGRRRTQVVNNGSDGSMVDVWMQGGQEGLERGWNVLLFDGPGEGAALVRQQLYFRPDWEAVLTPVVDFLVARDDVDPDRLALTGVSQAGYWVPRTLSREHRFAAGVADPGVVEVATTMLKQLNHSMVKELENGDREKFDKQMGWYERFSKRGAAMVKFRFNPYGEADDFDTYRRAMEFTLSDDDIAAITTPLLVTDPEDEQFWPGQSQELYDKLTGPKALVAFTRAEGANYHCEPMALGLRNERVFDWLDEQVPAD